MTAGRYSLGNSANVRVDDSAGVIVDGCGWPGEGDLEIRVFGCLHQPVMKDGRPFEVYITVPADQNVPVLYGQYICRKCRSLYSPDSFFPLVGMQPPEIELEETMALLRVDEVPPSRILEQIDVRERLMKQMVGTLYPRVLASEIDKLETQREKGKHRGVVELLMEHRV